MNKISHIIIATIALQLIFLLFIGCAHNNGMYYADNEINQLRSEINELKNEMDQDIACHFAKLVLPQNLWA